MSESSNDYATRDELRQAEARLDHRILETERLLRDRDDDLAKELRSEFVSALHFSEQRISQRIEVSDDNVNRRMGDLDEHLTRQDEFLIHRRINWKKVTISGIASTLGLLLAALIGHFVFGINIG